jgi:ABC-type nickel/cobalt efflux system permease component RcnA
MRTVLLITVICVALGGVLFWVMGGMDQLAVWAADGQREFQNAMARALRALRDGDPQALTTLLVVCFTYGFFHAVGPGHGKVLIGGYGVGRRIGLLRLSSIALMSSLAQSLSAVALVYAGVFLLNWSSKQMVNITENIMAPVSYGAIALIGVWLLWRGGRGFWRLSKPSHSSHQHADGTCNSCGHRHGPTPDEIAQLNSWRDTLILIGGIAIRPCTGALFLLVLTWRMDIQMAGILGALVMGLGTGSVTVAVAIASVTFRKSALMSAGTSARLAFMVPALEILAGGIVVFVALQLLRISL